MKTKKLIILSILMALVIVSEKGVRAECEPCQARAEETATAEAQNVELLVENQDAEEVEYVLPWPGILPDHPLYFLKMARDGVWGFLVRDPLKKAEWALLMADKRIWAGQMLIERAKEALGVTTLIKAEKYLEQALVKAEEAKDQGENIDQFLERLSLASQKHAEILEGVKGLVSEESQSVVEKTLEYPQKVYERVKKMRE